ncbi:hypothetical protein [Actinoallomurus rhizosphaericola]|uniref:hypothetical protein n=1 Tax=Actinoallomurus rhizosphaericola TaxID=2952536 RepID=UPI0020914F24|nr:hypothetical protein [Actinoallomurus rhizosphaericola]MCO5992022.1 hypothetical protein [Actinoallomurus rhizosphaericola]
MSTGQRRPVPGQVVSWDAEAGWGVLTSPEVPGEVWAHFSAIRLADPGGYRVLCPRESVLFTWEEADQDGYSFRAVEVRRASDVTGSPAWGQDESGDHPGYRSELDLRWDSDR